MGENESNETGGEATEEKDPKWYRTQIEERNQENAALKAKLLDQAFQIAGIDTTKGVGSTIRELYEAKGGEADASAIVEFAKTKFEFTPETPKAPVNPVAQEVSGQVNQATERADGVGTGAGSVETDSLADRIAEAEKAGDWALAISLKNEKLAALFGNR